MKFVFLFFTLLWVQPLQAQTIFTLDAPSFINAGGALTVKVRAEASTPISLRLYNGIQRLATTLIAEADGTATWELPPNTLISSGESLLIATADGATLTQTIQVRVGDIEQVDFLTTANNLIAYGQGQAMLISLVGDRYGNPVSDFEATVSIQPPNGETEEVPLSIQSGLGWQWFDSIGAPGRVRLTLSAASVRQSLELMQMPAAAAEVTLVLSPACVNDDGRDVITLQARVADEHGLPVSDSTLVSFQWALGGGSAQVFEGVASLRLPAPTAAGRYDFTASSGDVTSEPVALSVETEACS